MNGNGFMSLNKTIRKFITLNGGVLIKIQIRKNDFYSNIGTLYVLIEKISK